MMKLTKVVLVVALILGSYSLNAQELKFGHIDIQKLVSELPAKLEADAALQKEAGQLESNMKIMSEELDSKYQDYLAKRDTLPELIRATREKDIQDLDQRVRNFKMLAQQNLQKKEQELLQPIIESVQKAIDEVGLENGFIYIFDVSSKIVIYHSDKSTDVSSLVKIKLGVQ